MASFSINDSLDMAMEGPTTFLDVLLVQVIPGLDDAVLQGFYAGAGGGLCLAGHDAPDRKVKGI